MTKILIRSDYLLPGGDNWNIIRNAELLIEDTVVSYIGAQRNYPVGVIDRIIEGKNKLVMPGLVNAHTHAAMALLRGYADDMPLMDWLEQKIWPAEARLTKEDIYWGTLLAICEMIRGGTTCFADMYFHMEEVARACLESGIRASLAQGLIGLDASQGAARLEDSKILVSDWHGAGEGLITIMLGPHAPYTCPPQYLEKVISIAAELSLPMHIHLAETRGEVQDCLDKWGKRPIALMDSIGLFKQQVLAAHCVHLSEDEILTLTQRQVAIAHNPGSNLKLGSGIAPLAELLERGAMVSIGTDGAASNNNLDMLEEMRLASLLAKGSCEDPTVLPARKALKLATVNGARSLFLKEETGLLREGSQADLIMLDMDKPHFHPYHDLCAQIVYAASSADVEMVMVKGRVLMEGKKLVTVDEEKILHEANERAVRLTR